MKTDLKFEAIYPYTPEQVWRALTDPEALAEWLMPNDFEAVLGHKFQFRTTPGHGSNSIIDCEVLELDAPRRLAYAWRGGSGDTVVAFTLEPVPEGTRLRLEHTGFSSVGGTMASSLMSSGWEKKIQNTLPATIARLVGGNTAQASPPDVSQLLARYEQGPAALEEALRTVSDVDRDAGSGTWNARQTALHIVDAEIVGAERLRMLAAQPGALLKSYHGDVWAQKLGYQHLSLEPALALFRALRQCTAEVLRGLPREAWENKGVHEETGEITLENLLQGHCDHTEGHLREIIALAGARSAGVSGR